MDQSRNTQHRVHPWQRFSVIYHQLNEKELTTSKVTINMSLECEHIEFFPDNF